jgi:hypothetical protein
MMVVHPDIPEEACVLVKVDDAVFWEDGGANMVGHGIEHVKLQRISVSPGTDGLFVGSITTHALGASGATPSSSLASPGSSDEEGETIVDVSGVIGNLFSGYLKIASMWQVTSDSTADDAYMASHKEPKALKSAQATSTPEVTDPPQLRRNKRVDSTGSFRPGEFVAIACSVLVPVLLCIAVVEFWKQTQRLWSTQDLVAASQPKPVRESKPSQQPLLVV